MERIKILELGTVDSTNSFLQEYAGEEGELMTVAVCDFQTAGRGNGSNTWESEQGKNLTFSVKVRPVNIPANRQFALLEAMALAVRGVLAKEVEKIRSWAMLEDYDFMFGRSVASGTDCRGFTVKWPNDIYWDDRKISGTLSECVVGSSGVRSCIIGTGININQTRFLSDAPNPVSLAQIMRRNISRDAVLKAVLDSFAEYLEQLYGGGFDAVHSEYKSVLYRRTGSYSYSDAGGDFYARIEDVAENGRLLLRRDDGSLSEYDFKEVKFNIARGL